MSWKQHAACRGASTAMFFAPPTSTWRWSYKPAKQVCERCPVRQPCLDAGIDEPYGVWGGTDPKQREKLRGEPYRTRERGTA